jgi:hypothetical protein
MMHALIVMIMLITLIIMLVIHWMASVCSSSLRFVALLSVLHCSIAFRVMSLPFMADRLAPSNVT